MATRWSHAHGESYLRRKWSGSGVGDVERLTKELRFRGIGQWCSGLGGICSAVLGVLVAMRAEEGGRRSKWRGECVRAGAVATAGCARRVASALRRAATGGGHAASFF